MSKKSDTIQFDLPSTLQQLPHQVREDLLAVTDPTALPAMDWGDLTRTLESWAPWPWHHSITTNRGDLDSMMVDFCHAVERQQLALSAPPASAILVIRGNGAAFRLDEFKKVCNAIRSTLDASTELWFAAAHEQSQVDALRLTVVMTGYAVG